VIGRRVFGVSSSQAEPRVRHPIDGRLRSAINREHLNLLAPEFVFRNANDTLSPHIQQLDADWHDDDARATSAHITNFPDVAETACFRAPAGIDIASSNLTTVHHHARGNGESGGDRYRCANFIADWIDAGSSSVGREERIAIRTADGDDDSRSQRRDVPHGLRDVEGLRSDEGGFEEGLALFAEQVDDFEKVGAKFVERRALRVGARPAGHVAYKKAGIPITLDNRGVLLQGHSIGHGQRA